MQIALIDADNTLWDTDSVFSDAQLSLLDSVCKLLGFQKQSAWDLTFIRRYDQAIAAIHHAHLKYPAVLLVHALVLASFGSNENDAARAVISGRKLPLAISDDAVEYIVGDYHKQLASTPPLLPTVKDALELARLARVTMYVVTEGAVERQISRLRFHEIDSYFEATWELTKNEEQFRRLGTRFGEAVVTMIGDQIDRDVLPALKAGCRAIWVPGRFRPKWNDQVGVPPTLIVAGNLQEAITKLIADPSLGTSPSAA